MVQQVGSVVQLFQNRDHFGQFGGGRQGRAHDLRRSTATDHHTHVQIGSVQVMQEEAVDVFDLFGSVVELAAEWRVQTQDEGVDQFFADFAP